MTMTDEAQELSGQLAEAVKPTPAEYAAMVARFYTLKNVKHVTDDGEVLNGWQLDKELQSLSAILRNRVAEMGPIDVEGLPPLILEPRSERWLRFDLLITEAMGEPGPVRDKALTLIDELVRGGLLTVKWTLADALVKTGHLFGLTAYEVKGNGSPALKFDKRPR